MGSGLRFIGPSREDIIGCSLLICIRKVEIDTKGGNVHQTENIYKPFLGFINF